MVKTNMEVKNNIIFVYNANSSIFADLAGAITKVVAPSKYQCNLCKITYGTLSMKEEWREFLETLPFQKVFLHRKEFYLKYPEMKDLKLPAILIENAEGIKVIATSEEVDNANNLEDMKNLVRRAVE